MSEVITYMDRDTFETFELAMEYQLSPPPGRRRTLTEAEMDALDAEEAARRLADPTQVPIPFDQACREVGSRKTSHADAELNRWAREMDAAAAQIPAEEHNR